MRKILSFNLVATLCCPASAADRALSPAFITKLLTAYIALHVLSSNSRQTTTVDRLSTLVYLHGC